MGTILANSAQSLAGRLQAAGPVYSMRKAAFLYQNVRFSRCNENIDQIGSPAEATRRPQTALWRRGIQLRVSNLTRTNVCAGMRRGRIVAPSLLGVPRIAACGDAASVERLCREPGCLPNRSISGLPRRLVVGLLDCAGMCIAPSPRALHVRFCSAKANVAKTFVMLLGSLLSKRGMR